jgi:phage I-like protein
MNEEELIVCAELGTALDGQTPSEIVYMPKGRHKIKPNVNGAPKEIEVDVDAYAVPLLHVALAKRQAEPVRPCGAFDHRPGPASLLPKAFKWDDNRGVVLEVDWTESGKKAVSGRDYSYFSPTFTLDSRGKVAGLTEQGEIGSLTNNPAFRTLQKIAASGDSTTVKTKEIMPNKIAEKLAELQVITAAEAESADEAFVLRAVAGMHDHIQLVTATNKSLTKTNLELSAKVKDIEESEATRVIQAAIEEGKIPGKDEEVVAFYKEQYIKSPKTTIKVLASLSAATKREVTVSSTESRKGAGANGRTSADMIENQKRKVKEIRAANPHLDYDSAFNKAVAENPDIFPVEA